MTTTLRAALFAALTASVVPVTAEAQTTYADSLQHQIDVLERRAAELERRVSELEALIRAEPSRERRVLMSANWRDIQNWRRLRRGMSEEDVRALLGEPERVDAGTVTYWHWPDAANVSFMRNQLHGWSEPRR